MNGFGLFKGGLGADELWGVFGLGAISLSALPPPVMGDIC
jgi:hypothetical protein